MDDNTNNKIRVLVVDDSVLMSRQIAGILSEDDRIEVVGRAKDGLEALNMVAALRPDVITLDVEMPRMNGITALKHIMVKYSIPTVMISALTTEGARTTFDALKYGAIDVIAKPSRREDQSLEAQKADIVSKVRRAASIRMDRSRYIRVSHPIRSDPKSGKGPADENTRFIGVGAGTGGYYAMLRVIPRLGPDFTDVLVAVLLVSNRYVAPFISYLDSHSVVPVKGIRGVVAPERGICYVCSGEDGLILEKNAEGQLVFGLRGEAEDTGDSPIDTFLGSLVVCGPRAVGVIMTGSGSAGAEGFSSLRQAGGVGVIQDINNCLDPRMPLAALQRDAPEKILPDYLMADYLMTLSAGISHN